VAPCGRLAARGRRLVPAIERIRRGEAYYGESFVKDNAYIAGYEPIRDGSGSVIGIYATGYVKR
jgi:hypothetical protein